MPTLFPETMIIAAADRAACRALLRNGSRTFFAASHLLPRRIREPATALYAFCRLADDAVDLGEGDDCRRRTLERLRERLDRAYRGEPLPLPADRAFADTVRGFSIPRELPSALIEGLAWDTEGRRYETLGDLHAYAARVAGTVGVMMALVMGTRDAGALARACDLGAAMQLTNIARDVGEDAALGRLYLPLAWLRESGIDPDAWLAAPHFSPAIGAVVARLLAEADRLYRSSESGIADLPRACRPGIRAARLLYAEIGRAVARREYDSVTARARVPGPRKARLLMQAATPRRHVHADLSQRPAFQVPAIAEARFLIEAVGPAPQAVQRRASVGEQIVWVFDLFERIEQRRQLESGA